MPKKFLRRYLPGPTALRRNNQLRLTLGALLHDPNLWHLNRRSVAGGIALGLFLTWIPLPGQMVAAGLLALLLRVNLPLSVVVVWVSNPVTMGPMYWFGWWLGAALLGREHIPRRFEFTFDWFTSEVGQIWQPLFLGCLIMAAVSAGAGFLVVRLFWRYHVIRSLLERRRTRKDRAAEDTHGGR